MLRALLVRGLTFSNRSLLRINKDYSSTLSAPFSHEFLASKKWYSNQPNPEEKMKTILSSAFPKAKSIEVVDVSGGCGAMYEIYVEAPQFKGLAIVKQHRLVTDALKEEIKDMHGLRIQTSPT